MPVPAPPTIPTLPTAPARGVADPVTYVDLADGWAAAQQPWSVKVGETGTWMQARANEVQANADTVATNTETVEEDAAQVAADKATTVAAKNTAVQAKTDILNLYGSAAALDAAVESAASSAGAASTSAGAAADQVALATAQAQNAARAVVNNFPDRLDSTGAWFTESSTGDPGSVANASAAAIVNVAGYGYEYLKANAQGQLFAKGVLSASSGKYYEVEAEVEWTVKGASETPAFTVGVQGLDGSYANAGGQVQATLQAVAATGVQTFKYRFGYTAPSNGAAWPSPGTSVWLRPYVLFNRKSDNSGAVTASTARVRRLTVRDVTSAVLAEAQAIAAAASAASISLADQASAESGVGVGLMSATRVNQAILAQALPVGATLQAAANPGSRFLPCTGLNYLNASYPTLAPLMKPYVPGLTLRKSLSGGAKLAYGAGLFGAFSPDNSYNTSPDGITWTARTNPFGAVAISSGFAFGGGLFVVGPQSGSGGYYTSTDGFNYTARTRPAFLSTASAALLVYGNGWFYMAGKNGSNILAGRSADGIAWTGGAANSTSYILAGACYSAQLNRFAILDSYGNFFYSDDLGATLNLGPNTSSPNGWAGIACNANCFVAVGANGIVRSSTGTAAWAAITDPAVNGKSFNGIYCDGARFYAFGDGGLIVTSVDGFTWSAMPTGTTQNILNVIRSDAAITTPLVVAVQDGLYTGLEQSTTQFLTPVIAADASNLAVYIKAA